MMQALPVINMQETDLQKAGEDHNAEGDEDVKREKQHCIRSARRPTQTAVGERRRVGDVPRRKKFGSDSTYIWPWPASESVIVWVFYLPDDSPNRLFITIDLVTQSASVDLSHVFSTCFYGFLGVFWFFSRPF